MVTKGSGDYLKIASRLCRFYSNYAIFILLQSGEGLLSMGPTLSSLSDIINLLADLAE